jgi:alpha-beta hydrolase superfamily lysophospholipase
MLGICRWLVAAGFQCVVHDSRGHGEAAANYATFGAREVADLGAVLKTARAAAGGRFEPIGIYGYSMGGAIALQSLPDHPEIKAAVTAATFADLQNVLYHQAGMRYHGALKPLMPAVRWSVESKAGFDPFEIRPVEAVKKAQTPLMLIHGEHDTVVPVAHSQRLAQACGKERCVCRMVNGAAHGNVISKGGETLMLEMVQFYMRHLRK